MVLRGYGGFTGVQGLLVGITCFRGADVGLGKRRGGGGRGVGAGKYAAHVSSRRQAGGDTAV